MQTVATTIAYGIMNYYASNQSGMPNHEAGPFPYLPYCWRESGAIRGGFIDSGGTTFVDGSDIWYKIVHWWLG